MGERVDIRGFESELRSVYNERLFWQDSAMAKLEYLKFTRESRFAGNHSTRTNYDDLLHAPLTGDDLVMVLQDAGRRLLPTTDTNSLRFDEGIIHCYLEDNAAAPFAKLSLAYSGLSRSHVGRPLVYELSRVQEHRGDEDVTLRQYLTLYRTNRYSPFRETEVRVTTIHLLSGIATERKDPSDPSSRFVPIMEARDLLFIDDPMAQQKETEQLHIMLQALEIATRTAEAATH